MVNDFFTELLGSKARARLIQLFIFSAHEAFTEALAAKRAGVPLEIATKEIRVLEKMGVIKKGKFSIMLKNYKRVDTKSQKALAWTFNPSFKHARALTAFVHEIAPTRYGEVVDVLKRSGRLAAVILSGSFMGDPTRPADLIVAGEPLHEGKLERAVRALEPRFGREIRYAVFSTPEFRYRLTIQDRLIRDTLDYPHLVLLDKARLL